jgi:pimeloyl-ACP methyl ester carboxylesterase
MSDREDLLRLPGITTTLRRVPCPHPRQTVVFFHGLLGDGRQWDVFNYHTPPATWADCLYLDFHFEARRAESLTFADMLRDTTLLLRAASGRFGLVDGEPECLDLAAERRRGLPTTFVGSSFGGHLALHLASRGPVRPDNLVLFASGGIPEAARQRGLLKSYRTVDKIFEVSFERIFSEPGVAQNAEISDLLRTYKERIEPHRRVFIRNLLDLSRSMMESSLTHEELRRLHTRTLLVWGKRDIVTPPEIGTVFADLLPNARTLWVDAGHASHVERADVGSRALRAFCLHEDEYAPHAMPERAAALAG